MVIILVPWRLKQKDHKFKATLSYVMRLCLIKTKLNETKMQNNNNKKNPFR